MFHSFVSIFLLSKGHVLLRATRGRYRSTKKAPLAWGACESVIIPSVPL